MELTPEQKEALKKLAKKSNKDAMNLFLRMVVMLTLFNVATVIIGMVFVPGSDGFIMLGNAIGFIFVAADAIEASHRIRKNYDEEYKKVLRS